MSKHLNLAGSILNVVEDFGDSKKGEMDLHGFQIKIKPIQQYWDEHGWDTSGVMDNCEMCGGVAEWMFDATDDLGEEGGVPLPYCHEHAISSINYEIESNGSVLEIDGLQRTTAL